jgi:hypothetical protein
VTGPRIEPALSRNSLCHSLCKYITTAARGDRKQMARGKQAERQSLTLHNSDTLEPVRLDL